MRRERLAIVAHKVIKYVHIVLFPSNKNGGSLGDATGDL